MIRPDRYGPPGSWDADDADAARLLPLQDPGPGVEHDRGSAGQDLRGYPPSADDAEPYQQYEQHQQYEQPEQYEYRRDYPYREQYPHARSDGHDGYPPYDVEPAGTAHWSEASQSVAEYEPPIGGAGRARHHAARQQWWERLGTRSQPEDAPASPAADGWPLSAAESPTHDPGVSDPHDEASEVDGLLGVAPASRRSALGDRRRRGPASAAVGAATEVVIVLGMALVLSLLIKTFLVQAFFIPSQSMENTLLTGDRVLVSKLTPGPFSLHRGDVIVFKDPGGWLQPSTPPDDGPVRSAIRGALTFVGLLPQDSGEHLIKRLIGLGGDHVKCCDSRGRITVNGVGIDEPYLYPGNNPSDRSFDVVVPAGHVWVMGDHRSLSEDSRFHPDLDKGTVPVDDIVGKAFVVVWPLGRAGGLSIPDTVFARVPEPSASP